ncbi:MAG: chemotaxis protein CheX [Deltaproteobacteria bacterium]|nr:chemotaxis protein CheX [Deltaproteobacteria bacterium]
MGGIQTIDLKGFVTNAVKGVFQTMLSMSLELEEPPNFENITTGKHIVGTVGFAGAAMGNVSIFVSRQFACEIAAAMLSMTVDDIGSDEEVHDVIGEVCNMVGGDLKSRLCDSGFTCSLSIPSVTFGESFRTESKGWDRHERYGVRNSHHSALMEVYIKAAN